MRKVHLSFILGAWFLPAFIVGCGGNPNDEQIGTENDNLVPLEASCGEFVEDSYIVHYAELRESDLDNADQYPDTVDWTELDLTEEEEAVDDPETLPLTPEMKFILEQGGVIENVLMPQIPAFSAIIPPETLQQLRRNPAIAFIERDCIAKTTAVQSDAPWGLDRIDERERPTDGSYHYVRDGRDVDAYVIDSGVLKTHEEFDGRVRYLHSYHGEAGGFFEDGYGPHGTHVAGILAGQTSGVAKRARIQSIRVFGSDGSAPVSRIAAGVRRAIKHHERVKRPAVANMSLGVKGGSRSLDTVVLRAIDAGISVVVSAGNDRKDACNQSPARVESAITVAATNSEDGAADFSNWGDCVDIYAPGVQIRSAWNTSNADFRSISGTSMAAPHVAGVVANYLQTHRRSKPKGTAKAILDKATRGVVTGGHENNQTPFLYAGAGIVAADADHLSSGGLLVSEYIECGIDPYLVFTDLSFTADAVPSGYDVVISSTPDGVGKIIVDDALMLECSEVTSTGEIWPGTTKSFMQRFDNACTAPSDLAPINITSMLSPHRNVACRLGLGDVCGQCVGNSNLFLAYVPKP